MTFINMMMHMSLSAPRCGLHPYVFYSILLFYPENPTETKNLFYRAFLTKTSTNNFQTNKTEKIH